MSLIVLHFFQVNDQQISQLYDKHLIEYERLKVFFFLKQVLAPVIEGLILMDRLLYLYEQVLCIQCTLYICIQI